MTAEQALVQTSRQTRVHALDRERPSCDDVGWTATD
jgi:hypothetical protein